MSLNDTIDGLANASITVSRTTRVAPVKGRKVAGTTMTLGPFDAVVQPAFNLNRVIGGADLDGTADNQKVVEIYQVHTTVELHAGEEIDGVAQYEPDVVTYKGKQYTVARVEGPWDLGGQQHWHAVITRQTKGGV